MTESPPNKLRGLMGRVDAWQQRRPAAGFPVAVGLRYVEDRGRYYASLLSYYGFFSLFPLALVSVTIVGLLTQDEPTRREDLLNTLFADIPVLGDALADEVDPLQGSGVVLLIAIVVTLWAGLAVVQVAQDSLNIMWGIPRYRRPGFVRKRVRSLLALLAIGAGFLIGAAITGATALVSEVPLFSRVIGALIAIVVNAVLVWISYQVLSAPTIPWRQLVPGAMVGGLLHWALQLIGGSYIRWVIVGASEVYGVFATVFGLLVWIALIARAWLFGSFVNVVGAKRLWPRTITGELPTDADRRALEQAATRETWLVRDSMSVDVDVAAGDGDADSDADADADADAGAAPHD